MNILRPILFLSVAALASGAPVLAPIAMGDAFKDSQFAMPSLALPTSAPAPAFQPHGAGGFGRQNPEVKNRRRVRMEEGMPVLVPDPNVDYKLIVKTADPKIDPKILFPAEAK